jgi:uncharacterized protein YrrD
MIRFEESRGRPIVTRKEGAIIGKLDDFQFDLRSGQVFGYLVRATSLFRKAGGVRAEDLDQVGRDVAFIGSESQVEWIGGSRNTEDGRTWASRYLGTRIVTRDGAALGTVDDLVFHPGDRQVVAVVVSSNRIIRIDSRVSTGPAVVVLAEERIAVPMPEAHESELPEAWWRRVLDATSASPDCL